jgi:outer membrane protein OmpA-like peptidoglycan-associated protein
MPYVHVSPRPSSLRRALVPAVVFTLLPLAAAFAQSHVRVTKDGTEISSLRGWKEVRMTAPRGTVLEVMVVDGDRYKHLDRNWYWLQLPQDAWGTRPVGWIRGDAVEHVPAPVAAPGPRASVAEPAPATAPARTEPREATGSAPPRVSGEYAAEARPARALVSDVVVNFEFGRSELTEEARRKLASAVAGPVGNAQGLSVALEGHADWVGGEAYNERLGLARAESVRRYLSEQFQIPVHRIDVVSYGENSPAAPNTTREGRASNRRVVLKGGA